MSRPASALVLGAHTGFSVGELGVSGDVGINVGVVAS